MPKDTIPALAMASYSEEERTSLAHAITQMAMFHPNGRYARTDRGVADLTAFVASQLNCNKAPVVAFAVMNWLDNWPTSPIGNATGLFSGFDTEAVNEARRMVRA